MLIEVQKDFDSPRRPNPVLKRHSVSRVPSPDCVGFRFLRPHTYVRAQQPVRWSSRLGKAA